LAEMWVVFLGVMGLLGSIKIRKELIQ